jgi:predicted ATPase
MVGDLLAAAGGLQVLVTSRRRLGLAVEVVQTVGPLAPPDAEDRASVKASPAVRLLVERASAVRPDFAVTDDNAAAVAALCRRLDGLPLAIELAAARLGSAGVAELEALLGDHMEVLGRPDPGVSGRLDRHGSLAAAVDWS